MDTRYIGQILAICKYWIFNSAYPPPHSLIFKAQPFLQISKLYGSFHNVFYNVIMPNLLLAFKAIFKVFTVFKVLFLIYGIAF